MKTYENLRGKRVDVRGAKSEPIKFSSSPLARSLSLRFLISLLPFRAFASLSARWCELAGYALPLCIHISKNNKKCRIRERKMLETFLNYCLQAKQSSTERSTLTNKKRTKRVILTYAQCMCMYILYSNNMSFHFKKITTNQLLKKPLLLMTFLTFRMIRAIGRENTVLVLNGSHSVDILAYSNRKIKEGKQRWITRASCSRS